ncbi:MAG: Ig-like domain-containing protein, partial [Halobaculum sp.]
MRGTLPVVVLVVLAASSGVYAVGGSQAADELTITQTPTETTVQPGEKLTVTVTLTAPDHDGPAVDLTLPDGWSVVEQSAPGATYKPAEHQWLWLRGGEKTLTYTVRVPADAEPGTYRLTANGSAVAEGTDEIVTEETTTTVTVEDSESSITGSITSPAPGTVVGKPALRVEYELSGSDSFESVVYRVDGGQWQPVRNGRVRSSFVLTGLTEGEHVLTLGVRLDDETVPLDSRRVTVDTTPPAVGDAGLPAVSNGSLRVTPNVTDEITTVRRVELVAVGVDTLFETSSTNGSTLQFGSAPDGTYRVLVRVTDEAGNTRTARIGTVERDTKSPTLGVAVVAVDATTGRVAVTSDEPLGGSPTVTVTTPDGSQIRVPLSRTDTGRYTGQFDLKRDGQYRASVTGTDTAGNEGSASSTTTIKTGVDVSNGTATLLTGNGSFVRLNVSNGSVRRAVASLTASDSPLDQLTDRLRGGQFVEGELGAALSENLSSAVIGIPLSEVELPSSVSAESVQIRRYNETAASWERVGTTTVERRTVEGTTRRYLVVTVSHFSTYGAVVTDETPPTVESVSVRPTVPSDGTYAYETERVTATVTYTDTLSGVDPSQVVVRFDGTPVDRLESVTANVTAGNATITATGLVGSGNHTITVVVEDTAGNRVVERQTFTVRRDRTPPTLTTGLSNGTVVDAGNRTVRIGYTERVSGLDRKNVTAELRGGRVGSVTVTDSAVLVTVNATAGERYTLSVRVADRAGNVRTLSRTFRVASADGTTGGGGGGTTGGGGGGTT